jgi:hypothetical protein
MPSTSKSSTSAPRASLIRNPFIANNEISA